MQFWWQKSQTEHEKKVKPKCPDCLSGSKWHHQSMLSTLETYCWFAETFVLAVIHTALSYAGLIAQIQNVHTQIQANACWNMEFLHADTQRHSKLVTWCYVVVNDRIDSWAHRSFTYFTFHFFLLPQRPFFQPLQIFVGLGRTCVCLHAGAHPAGECVCHSVLLQGRGRSLSFSRNTPRTNVPHLCTVQHSLSSITGALH